jgi:hypothetical protein
LSPKKNKEAVRALIARLQEHKVAPLIAERLKKNGEVVHVWQTLTILLSTEGYRNLLPPRKGILPLPRSAKMQSSYLI